MIEGKIIGVFGSDPAARAAFLGPVAKKSEAEGSLVLYHRVEGGVPYSFLEDAQFPERIQGYSRIASLSDAAFYLLPKFGRMTAPDGELAVLVDALGLDGSLVSVDEPGAPPAAFKGLRLERYPVEERSSKSSVIDLTKVGTAPSLPGGTLVYIDRAFSVKGVGLVVLGFVVSGKVSVHDQLRLVPGDGKTAEVRGIQVHDVDHDSVGRGVRVGLSLKGVELKDLDKVSWMDDGSIPTSEKVTLEYRQSGYYKQSVDGRDMHLQLPGEVVTCKTKLEGGRLTASLAAQAPVWDGMRVGLIDLNGKGLRVAGGGVCRI